MNAPFDALSPALAVMIGIAFGAALERAGLGDARKLANQFYAADFTVLKVMFSAIVTAMLGAYSLARLGMLDLARVSVPETHLAPQLAGGLLFGAGFAIAGLCPGTSCVAAATGRGDGVAVMLGMFAGVLGTGLAFNAVRSFYESTARGALTLSQLLGVPYGVVVCGVVVLALLAFQIAERMEARTPNRESERESDRESERGLPARRIAGFQPASIKRRLEAGGPAAWKAALRSSLAIVALSVSVVAAVSGSPYRRDRASIDVAQLAHVVAAEEDHVTALELAQWIRDRKAGLRVIDLRSASDFAQFHLPRAERVSMDAITSMPFAPSETIVLISDGGAHAAQAWVFLRALGHEHVFFLRGGVGEWLDEVMNPKTPSDLTRYFGSMPRSDDASLSIEAMRRRGC